MHLHVCAGWEDEEWTWRLRRRPFPAFVSWKWFYSDHSVHINDAFEPGCALFEGVLGDPGHQAGSFGYRQLLF